MAKINLAKINPDLKNTIYVDSIYTLNIACLQIQETGARGYWLCKKLAPVQVSVNIDIK